MSSSRGKDTDLKEQDGILYEGRGLKTKRKFGVEL